MIGNRVIGEDEELYNYIKQQPGYTNYTDAQIHGLLKAICETGCSYVAAINCIFDAYQGREEDFEKAFGFPMIGKNGDLNYDMLLVDYYIETTGRVYLDESDGLSCFAVSMEHYYEDHPELYKKKYGEDLYDSNGELSANWYANCLNEAKEAEGKGIKTARFYDEELAITVCSVNNRLSHYCNERNVGISSKYIGNQML